MQCLQCAASAVVRLSMAQGLHDHMYIQVATVIDCCGIEAGLPGTPSRMPSGRHRVVTAQLRDSDARVEVDTGHRRYSQRILVPLCEPQRRCRRFCSILPPMENKARFALLVSLPPSGERSTNVVQGSLKLWCTKDGEVSVSIYRSTY